MQSNTKGNRVSPITAYKNSAESIDAVVKNKSAQSTGAGGTSSVMPKPLTEDESRAFADLERIMSGEVEEVNHLASF